MRQILAALRHGVTVEYTAERIRQDRAEAAEHERIRADLEAAGITITPDLPGGAVRLSALIHDEEDLTPETHVACPGRGAFFPMWDRRHPVHYCTDPAAYGHAVRSLLLRRGAAGQSSTGTPDDPAGRPGDSPADPDRRLVIEGNKAWKAARACFNSWLSGQK